MHYIDQEIDLSKKTPIENIAKENIDLLRWKFYDNETNKYSLCIEKDAVLNGVFNVKNFYTRMGVLMQMEIFRMIPWFENADFARFGLIHKDTYFNSPGFLNNFFKIKNSDQPIYIIGQLSGCDGYLRAFASAIIAANNIIYGDISLSKETMVGWLANYISNESITDFQPISATYGLIDWFIDPETQEKKSLKLINEYINQLSSN
jgi:methylenetetrahydrofolate--tRNA-(uracil-5-)-methyltransferase